MINKVTLIGRLGKDPEVRTLENGTTVTKFSIATDESYKDKAGEWQTITEWHNIICWRDVAERAGKMLKKGHMVYIDGKLTHRSWQDDQGATKYITEVKATTYRLLNDGSGSKSNEEAKALAADNATTTTTVTTDKFADDLPF